MDSYQRKVRGHAVEDGYQKWHNMTLTEAVDGILNQSESEAKELEIRKREKEEIEKKHKKYYEAHMKEETERLNKLVDWYKLKPNEISEAPVDSRSRKLEKLY